MRCVVCFFSLSFVFMLLSSKTTTPTTRAEVMKLEVGAYDQKFNHPLPYYTEISLGTPPQPVILALNMTTDLIWFVCGVKQGQTMPPVPADSNDTIPSHELISKPYSSPYAYNLNSTTSYSYIFSKSPLCPTSFNRDVNSSKILCAEQVIGLSGGAKATSERVFLSMDCLIINSGYADFIFSCAAYDSNISYTYKAAGVLGLGREELSLVSQLGLTFNNSFSYCLPPLLQDSTGYLSLGNENFASSSSSSSQPITHTSLIPDPRFYLIGMTSITIDGTKVSIDLSESNTTLDPGTLFTTLPRAAYNKMRDVVRAMNINIDINVGDFPPLDLCFDTRDGEAPLKIPTVEIFFGDDAIVELHESAIMYDVMDSDGLTNMTCLGFHGRSDDAAYNTLGGLQQAQMDVLFDLGKEMVGFRRNDDCGSG